MAGLGIALQAPVFQLPKPLGNVTHITIAYHERGYWLMETLDDEDKAQHLLFDDFGEPLPGSVEDS